MKPIIEKASLAALLGVSTFFGILGRPAEMGLIIVAGAISYSLVNLDKFTKIKGAGFEAELREKIETVIERETELPVSGEEGKPVPNAALIDVNTRSVINALRHPNYTWRYIGGIKEDTKLTSQEIEKSISWLISHGYVNQTIGKYGTLWNLTEEGRYLSAVIDFEDVVA